MNPSTGTAAISYIGVRVSFFEHVTKQQLRKATLRRRSARMADSIVDKEK
jgi:hypothetical protein